MQVTMTGFYFEPLMGSQLLLPNVAPAQGAAFLLMLFTGEGWEGKDACYLRAKSGSS